MLANKDQGWVYLAPPNCGTHTIRSVLLEHCEAVEIASWHTLRPIPEDYRELRVILSVRNPYERVLRQYTHRQRVCDLLQTNTAAWSLARYVRECTQRDFWPLQLLRPTAPQVTRWDHLLRVEHLQADWDQLGLADVTLPHLNKSRQRVGMEAYDDEARELVYEYYKQDFKEFGYPC